MAMMMKITQRLKRLERELQPLRAEPCPVCGTIKRAAGTSDEPIELTLAWAHDTQADDDPHDPPDRYCPHCGSVRHIVLSLDACS